MVPMTTTTMTTMDGVLSCTMLCTCEGNGKESIMKLTECLRAVLRGGGVWNARIRQGQETQRAGHHYSSKTMVASIAPSIQPGPGPSLFLALCSRKAQTTDWSWYSQGGNPQKITLVHSNCGSSFIVLKLPNCLPPSHCLKALHSSPKPRFTCLTSSYHGVSLQGSNWRFRGWHRLGAPGPCSDSENQLNTLSITVVQGVNPTCEFEKGAGSGKRWRRKAA